MCATNHTMLYTRRASRALPAKPFITLGRTRTVRGSRTHTRTQHRDHHHHILLWTVWPACTHKKNSENKTPKRRACVCVGFIEMHTQNTHAHVCLCVARMPASAWTRCMWVKQLYEKKIMCTQQKKKPSEFGRPACAEHGKESQKSHITIRRVLLYTLAGYLLYRWATHKHTRICVRLFPHPPFCQCIVLPPI